MLDALQAEGEAAVLVHWTLADDIRALRRCKEALLQGRPLPMALREARVWGAKERLYERVLPGLDAAALGDLVAAAQVCDGIVKGLRDPRWPAEPWAALRRLALQLMQAVRAARAGARRRRRGTASGVGSLSVSSRAGGRPGAAAAAPDSSRAMLAAATAAALRLSVCAATCGSTVTRGWRQNGCAAGSGSLAEDIEDEFAELAALERGECIGFHQVRAARQVDEVRSRLHGGQALRVEQPACAPGQRQQVDHDPGRTERIGQRPPRRVGTRRRQPGVQHALLQPLTG